MGEVQVLLTLRVPIGRTGAWTYPALKPHSNPGSETPLSPGTPLTRTTWVPGGLSVELRASYMTYRPPPEGGPAFQRLTLQTRIPTLSLHRLILQGRRLAWFPG